MNDLIMDHVILIKMSVTLVFYYVWVSLDACKNWEHTLSCRLDVENDEL